METVYCPFFNPLFPAVPASRVMDVNPPLPGFALQPYDGGLAAVGFWKESLFECGLGGFKPLVWTEDFCFTLRARRCVPVKITYFREFCITFFT